MPSQSLPNSLSAALKTARKNASGIETQRDAGEALKAAHGLSPSLIAQYETGKIKNPEPQTLKHLAEIYEADYLELALSHLWERYRTRDEEEGYENDRWRLLNAAVLASSETQPVTKLFQDILRSKAYLLRNYDVLDMNGMAHWERTFPNLKEIWIVAPDFLDDCHEEIEAAVAHNVGRSVLHYYFMPDDPHSQARHRRLQKRIADKSQVDLDKVKKFLRSIPLSIEDLTWLHSDVIIANPRVPGGAEGYITIRKNGVPDLAIQMEPGDAESSAMRLDFFVQKHEEGEEAREET